MRRKKLPIVLMSDLYVREIPKQSHPSAYRTPYRIYHVRREVSHERLSGIAYKLPRRYKVHRELSVLDIAIISIHYSSSFAIIERINNALVPLGRSKNHIIAKHAYRPRVFVSFRLGIALVVELCKMRLRAESVVDNLK